MTRTCGITINSKTQIKCNMQECTTFNASPPSVHHNLQCIITCDASSPQVHYNLKCITIFSATPPAVHHQLCAPPPSLIRKGGKKIGKSLVFDQTGGGSPRLHQKPNPKFDNVFINWGCRTILGPQKHVLHLVWSAYVYSKTIKIALKAELLRFFLYSRCFPLTWANNGR